MTGTRFAVFLAAVVALLMGSGAFASMSYSQVLNKRTPALDANDELTVALSGNGRTAMFSAPPALLFSGIIYPFYRSAGFWNQVNSIASSGTGLQGRSLALDYNGTTLVYGATLDGFGKGAVFVWSRVSVFTTTWTQDSKFTDATSNANFGIAVAISDDANVMAGARGDNVGGVQVYVKNGGGTFVAFGARITATSVGQAKQGQSLSLSADGSVLAFGGPSDNSTRGAVWVYTRGVSSYTFQAKLVVPNSNSFGRAVALSPDGLWLVAGGQALAVVYQYSAGSWTLYQALTGAGSTNGFGSSVAFGGFDNERILVGDINLASNRGGVFHFTKTNSLYSQTLNPIWGTGFTGSSNQGSSVAISRDGSRIFVGADGDASGHGAGWFFDLIPTSSPTASPTTSPTTSPTWSPTTSQPTTSPTHQPTTSPTTSTPTTSPTTSTPTASPTARPTASPIISTAAPTGSPSAAPTNGVLACRPSYGLKVKQCKNRIKRCKRLGIYLKWNPGCKDPVTGRAAGDGGCQCLPYCGYSCESSCNKDSANCYWDGVCKVKSTGEPGVPIPICARTSLTG